MTTELQMEAPPAYNTTPATISSTEAPVYDQPASHKFTVPSAQPHPQRYSNSSNEPVNRGLIICGLICCALFGRIGYIYNAQAVQLYQNKSIQAGDEAAQKARLCSITAIVVGTLLFVGVVGGITAWQVLRIQARTF